MVAALCAVLACGNPRRTADRGHSGRAGADGGRRSRCYSISSRNVTELISFPNRYMARPEPLPSSHGRSQRSGRLYPATATDRRAVGYDSNEIPYNIGDSYGLSETSAGLGASVYGDIWSIDAVLAERAEFLQCKVFLGKAVEAARFERSFSRRSRP